MLLMLTISALLESKIYTGWIIASPDDRLELEVLGVELGDWDQETGCFENCKVPAPALEKLDRYWGRFTWGLEPEEASA